MTSRARPRTLNSELRTQRIEIGDRGGDSQAHQIEEGREDRRLAQDHVLLET